MTRTPATVQRTCRPFLWIALLIAAGGHPFAHGAGSNSASYAALVKRVSPSVVTVLVEERGLDAGARAAERAGVDPDDEAVRTIVRRMLGGPGSTTEMPSGGSVLGSGFVIRPDGIIVTNRHVVVGARTVRVRLPDGRELPARVLGADAATDIAVLKVDADPLPALRLGSTAAVSVGDAVIAIGNPFGLGQTVTAGIVSARGRTLEDDPYIDFLQTDAAINRGNSGGPLITDDGTVVGVTSIIFSPSGGSVGLGFAIPAETVAEVARDIETKGRVDRGFLGISAQAVTPGIATALGLKTARGALINALEPQGPASGRLAVGDVILQIGTRPVSFGDLGKATARLAPGTSVDLTVLRDGVEQNIGVTLGRLPDPPTDATLSDGLDTWIPALAIRLAPATTEIRKAIQASDEPNGLIVTTVRRGGAGAFAGLRVGDLLTQAGTKPLKDVSDLQKITAPTAREPLLLRVVRGGAPSFIAITGTEEP